MKIICIKLGSDNMVEVVAKYDGICLLMDNRDNTNYNNLIKEVLNDLTESINIALKAGVKPENIITDPVIGFAKTYEQNLEVMIHLEFLRIKDIQSE